MGGVNSISSAGPSSIKLFDEAQFMKVPEIHIPNMAPKPDTSNNATTTETSVPIISQIPAGDQVVIPPKVEVKQEELFEKTPPLSPMKEEVKDVVDEKIVVSEEKPKKKTAGAKRKRKEVHSKGILRRCKKWYKQQLESFCKVLKSRDKIKVNSISFKEKVQLYIADEFSTLAGDEDFLFYVAILCDIKDFPKVTQLEFQPRKWKLSPKEFNQKKQDLKVYFSEYNDPRFMKLIQIKETNHLIAHYFRKGNDKACSDPQAREFFDDMVSKVNETA